ncbi:DUF2357 domain-containing protein [Pseudomonas sp. UL073]|uniref:DUF2357 domain-containing protein n=1 Tax=Zestomonas insulae TaxID=2809017 RepID=A0ABS2IBQ8_9GAMM|nr:DUF2357 domain-containing protein [Pseudomonas insulae]MBM7059347.1 DUF2357 domain-containing protein [Pseudomonas insulae]
MITVRRRGSEAHEEWIAVAAGEVVTGFHEDTHYEIRPEPTTLRVFVDDVELLAASGWFQWCPRFYAGQVRVDVLDASGAQSTYCLTISPTAKKADDDKFAEIIEAIRTFDQTLLGGVSAATLAFGNTGRAGIHADHVLLARLRLYGHEFLGAVAALARSPHQKLSADRQMLPLARARRLHPTALREHKLSTLLSGTSLAVDQLDTIQVHAWTSTPTVDTPANRVLLGLLKRFRATLTALRERVAALRLGDSQDEQGTRLHRRIALLDHLESRVTQLIQHHPFNAVKAGAAGSSGLTQIAAQPAYNRAYRLGCAAMASRVEGDQSLDQLHVSPSWGIYETWCFLQVVACFEQLLGIKLTPSRSKVVNAQLAFHVPLSSGHLMEVLFQAKFPAADPHTDRLGWSISRERVPDILIVVYNDTTCRSLILDAKWRSGRANVLEAMESAHIYHDSLRLRRGSATERPSHCILLLPGASDVESLGELDFIHTHGVGAIAEFLPHGAGVAFLSDLFKKWLSPLHS